MRNITVLVGLRLMSKERGGRSLRCGDLQGYVFVLLLLIVIITFEAISQIPQIARAVEKIILNKIK